MARAVYNVVPLARRSGASSRTRLRPDSPSNVWGSDGATIEPSGLADAPKSAPQEIPDGLGGRRRDGHVAVAPGDLVVPGAPMEIREHGGPLVHALTVRDGLD